MVRPLNIPNQEQAPPVDVIRPRAKALNIPVTPTLETTPQKKVKVLGIQDQVYVPNAPRAKPKTRTEQLIDKAREVDPNIEVVRIRTRIDTLLSISTKDLLNWGERNLAPLRAASNIQGQIVSRMAQINATGWIKETMEASTKIPSRSLFGAKPKPPEYYEGMIQKARGELMQLVEEITNVRKNYEPDVTDLYLDAVSLMVAAPDVQDSSDRILADNRARSLMASHQTGAMLLQTIDQIKLQCAQFIQQIDDLMAVALPQWKMAFKR